MNDDIKYQWKYLLSGETVDACIKPDKDGNLVFYIKKEEDVFWVLHSYGVGVVEIVKLAEENDKLKTENKRFKNLVKSWETDID